MATTNSTPAAESTKVSTQTLKQVEIALGNESAFAWKIYNTLVFMVEALPTDTTDGLPVQCTLADMRCDMDKLATSLMNLGDSVSKARYGLEKSHE